ncbi:TonB-dependent receptor plug domain-containing protein [Perlabentimonas gracilis]|uniref:TonB-dependent receptor plug domain-containing protein n=1 Tax=Perlabentimonas gracilis TaxID=2715279 RepID=UPI0014085E30|nr:TonB-dependent receptor plug domain-containing protein [Perlabentimonas gracilis]NHB68533.1 TonB-dependent receptor [Perlabentimonas gracilis]
MGVYTKTCATVFFLLLCLASGAQVVNDSSYNHYLTPAILDASNVVNTIDTTKVSVISASRSAKYLSDLPLTIYVISHEEILLYGHTSLADVLKNLPGIRISQPGTGEYGEGFQLRGLPGNQYAKILINNVPVKPSVVAGMPIGQQLPVRQAERIEVIYGPAAAVYGADAVTGVINIILKEADKGTFVRGDVFVGEGNYNYANFTVGGKAGKNRNILDYSFYANKSEIPRVDILDGHNQAYNPLAILQLSGKKINLNGDIYDPIEITPSLLSSYGVSEQQFVRQEYGPSYKGSLTSPDFENIASTGHLIGLNVRYRGIGLTYNTMYRKTHSSLGLSPVNFRYDNPQNYWADKIHQFSLSYAHDFNRFSSSTNLSFLNYSMDNSSSMGLTKLESDRAYLYSESVDVLFEQLLTYSPTTNSEIVLGGSYQASSSLPLTSYMDRPFNPKWFNHSGTSTIPIHPVMGYFGFNPVSYHNLSVFSQGFAMYRNFNFLAGLRWDANSMYGQSFSPRIALLYKLSEKVTALSSGGFAFKAPPASITYRSLAYTPHDEPNRIKYIAIPSPSLKPESYKSLELGLKTIINQKVSANITAFYNQITDPIVNTLVPIDLAKYPLATAAGDSLWASTYYNSEKAISRLYGLQATLLFNNIIPRYKLNGELNLSLARQSDEAPELVEFIVSNIQLMPAHMGQFRITAQPHKNLFFRADMIWMTKWLRVLIPFEEMYSKLFSNVDGFFTIDFSANINLDHNLMVTIKGINILDEKYGGFVTPGLDYGLPYNPQIGRSFSIGLSYRFN